MSQDQKPGGLGKVVSITDGGPFKQATDEPPMTEARAMLLALGAMTTGSVSDRQDRRDRAVAAALQLKS